MIICGVWRTGGRKGRHDEAAAPTSPVTPLPIGRDGRSDVGDCGYGNDNEAPGTVKFPRLVLVEGGSRVSDSVAGD